MRTIYRFEYPTRDYDSARYTAQLFTYIDLGYKVSLSYDEQKVLAYALQSYGFTSKDNTIKIKRSYWDSYAKQALDKYCDKKGLKPLKPFS